MRRSLSVMMLCLAPLLTRCGSDYTAPRRDATGLPAAPLGQTLDIEVELPSLRVQGSAFAGVSLDLTLELERGGVGKIPARVVPGEARFDMESAPVEELSGGRIDVFVSPESWTTSRIGPLRIGNTVFEVILDGDLAREGWSVAGRSWESQSGVFGTFEGWRRHRFLVTQTDFFSSVGRVAEVALIKEREIRVRQRLELVSSDPALRVTGRAVLAVNRLTFDNLQRLDPREDFRTSWQRSVGVGSNPHDVLVIGEDKAYVTRYEPPFDDVAVVDPRDGSILSTIPLADLANNDDGTPRPDRMRRADGLVFVGLQDIDRTFTRFSEGKLAVIDPTLDEVANVIPLGGKNPGAIEVVTGEDGRTRLYVALAGVFPGLQVQELSGGVVAVDVLNQAVERMVLEDDEAGGNIAALTMRTDRLGYAVVSDASFVNRVVAFDPVAGTVLREILTTTDLIGEIELDGGGVLAIPDRSFYQPRLCLYRVPAGPDGTEEPIGCGALELPPFSIEALD